MTSAPAIVINLPGYPFDNLLSVSSIAGLRAMASGTLTDGANIAVDYGAAAGDGLGGLYAWTPSSTDDDNGGSVIKPTDVPALSAGRWVLTNDPAIPADSAASSLAASLSAPTGSTLVGFLQSGADAIARAMQDKGRETISVADFGAVGDGATDDQPAFVKALAAAQSRGGGLVFVPDPQVAYKIGTGPITLPPGGGFYGQTAKRTKLVHAFNGNMFVMGDCAALIDLYLDGNGANFTGRCMDFQGGDGRQTVRGVRASDWDGEVQYYATAAGSQASTHDCRFYRTNAGTGTGRYAVAVEDVQQLSAKPRKFSLMDFDGTCSFDFGGANNVEVVGGFLGDVKFSDESRAVKLTAIRLANQLEMTLAGHNNTIVGCDISPQITIAPDTDNCAIQGNSYNNLPIIDNSGNNRNLVDFWTISYTPTLAASGTAPDLGDGTLVGYASRKGNVVQASIVLTVGSTTNLGTGELRFGIPDWAPNSNGFVQTPGTASIAASSATYTAAIQLLGHAQYVRLVRDGTGPVSGTSPATLAAGDIIRLTFAYMV